MSSFSPYTTPPRLQSRVRRRRLGRLLLGIALRIVVLAAVFAVGVALGESLHDNPKPGGTHTGVRRLKPLPLPPVRRTVTVTTAAGG